MPPKYLRRLVTFPGLALFTFVLLIGFPLWIVVATLVDLVVGIRRGRCIRTVAFLLWMCTIEIRAVARSVAIWVRFRGRVGSDEAQHLLQRNALAFYGHEIIRATKRIFGLKIEVTGGECLADGAGVVCFPHHTSILDSVLPIDVLSHGFGYDVRYVVKKSLAWGPAIDLAGHWLPVHYVDRTGKNTESELQAIGDLAKDIAPMSAPIIYPEGTFYTKKRHLRAVERLRSQAPELVERAKQLRYVLPPRTGGPMAMLDTSPDADVLFIAHCGFEPFVNMPRIFANLPFRNPVRVHFWRVPRSDVPSDAKARYRWLFSEFERMDAWVAEQLEGKSQARGAA